MIIFILIGILILILILTGNATLIISNVEMNDIVKIVQALEDSNIFLKGVTETIENETK